MQFSWQWQVEISSTTKLIQSSCVGRMGLCHRGSSSRGALSVSRGEMPCCRGGVSLYVLSLYVWAGEAVTKSPPGVFVDPVSDFRPEPSRVTLKVLCSLDVQRVLEVEQIGEQRVETPNDVLEPTGRCPSHALVAHARRSQDRQAHVTG